MRMRTDLPLIWSGTGWNPLDMKRINPVAQALRGIQTVSRDYPHSAYESKIFMHELSYYPHELSIQKRFITIHYEWVSKHSAIDARATRPRPSRIPWPGKLTGTPMNQKDWLKLTDRVCVVTGAGDRKSTRLNSSH